MKNKIALILLFVAVLLCSFILSACKDGVDGKDGIDGKDGVGIVSVEKTSTSGLVDTYTMTFTDGTTKTFTVTNGANGTNGSIGKDGQSAYELFKAQHPDYQGDEQQWLNDIASGALASKKSYQVITYGKNLFANILSGTATGGNATMTLSTCVAQLNEPMYLPVDENSSWQINISGVLATVSGGVQLLNSSSNVVAGRVYFAANAGQNKIYLGVNIGGVYFNYCWSVPAATINGEHEYAVRYSQGLYQLSIDGQEFVNFDSFNYDQSGTGTAEVEDALVVSADLTSKIRAVMGQNCIVFTYLGAQSFAANSKIAYLTAESSSAYQYQQMVCHPLYGKTIYHLGSSISYGSANGGVSFADQIRDVTGSKMVKQTVSGTTLSAQKSNSYAQRWSNFTFTDNPDYLIIQLSTNDFTNSGITLGAVGTQKEGFDKNTTAGALEYIISETLKKSPDTKVVIYSCAVRESWAQSHSEYTRFANIELAKLQQKWGILIVDLFSLEPLLPNIMSDDIHPNKQGYALLFTPTMINVLLDDIQAK